MEILQTIRYWIIAGSCLLAALPMLFCLGAWLHTSPGLRRLFASLNHQLHTLTPFGKIVAVVFLSVCILLGGGKTNSALLRLPLPSGIVFDGGQMQLDGDDAPVRRLTTNQYGACFALFRVQTNTAAWPFVPSNAVLYAPWTRYGVAEDTFWLPACAAEPGDAAGRPATNWAFILGTNSVEGLHVSSSGTISFGWPKGSPRAREMPDGSQLDFLAPLQSSIGIVPPVGRFWHAPTPSNSLLLTWQDVYANRDTNYPISFQSELYANGDFTFRYDLSRLSPTAHCQLPTANWAIGAQHNGGGETYAFGDTNLLVNGLELRWRAFGLLDPDIDDHDGDGLSTYDEVMTHGTDPRLADTDFDGMSDPDELAALIDPCNPDSDGDGLADGIDPQPLVWNDPDDDADNDGMGYRYEIMHGFDPAHDDSTDSDNDGWANWKELLAGTDPHDPASIPVDEDGLPGIFTVTFTLNADLPGPAVLTVGPHTLPLKQAGSRSLTLKAGTAYTAALYTMVPYTVKLSATFSDACVALIDPSGIFSGTFIAGRDAATALIALPVIVVSPSRVCFHESDTTNLTAVVTPALTGGFLWMWSNGDISDLYGRTTKITWEGAPGESTLYLSFLAGGANQERIRSCKVAKCSWVPGGTAYGPASEGVVPVNNDDDDASGVLDVAETSLAAGDDDLAAVQPIGSHSGDCCDCPEHKAIYGASADLQICSAKLKIYNDTCKSNVFGGTVLASATVYVEELEASTAVNAERLVWAWTDDNQVSRLITNAFTVLSLRLFGDLNFDGEVNAEDKALHPTLTPEFGWIVPVDTNSCRKAQLRTDINLPGVLTLTLSGGGAFRVWQTATPGLDDVPMLVGGQTVTNGINGVFWETSTTANLYIQAASNGTAMLTYAFVGTGAADGIASRASLKMTAVSVTLALMWETSNSVNQIFNPTRKDDSTGITAVMEVVEDESYAAPRNNLYVVGDPSDGKYRISLDLNIQPVGQRNRLLCAAYDGADKVERTDTPVPAEDGGPVEMAIPGPGDEQTVTYGIRAGFDVNGNGTLDVGEPAWPLEVYRRQSDNNPRYANLRGISKEMYEEHYGDIDGFVHFLGQNTPSLVAPNARSFLALFLYNGNMARIASTMRPSSTNSVPINVFADGEGFAEWLTHNSGATFNDNGVAAIQTYLWDDESTVAQFMANRTPFALKSYAAGTPYFEFPTETGTRLLDFYNACVKDAAEAALASATNNATVVFPQDGGWYDTPCEGATNLFASLSPKISDNWIVPSTQLVGTSDDSGGWYALAINFLTGTPTFDDFDAFATVGRGRVVNPHYRFTVQKQHSWLSGTRYVVTDVEFSCDIEDLYDFNYEDGAKSAAAAALQLGFGKGTGASPDRNGRGRIFRHTIQIRKTYAIPFTYNSY